MYFMEWKFINFDYDFTEVCSQEFINNISGRRQAIIWTNDGQFTDAHIRHSALVG